MERVIAELSLPGNQSTRVVRLGPQTAFQTPHSHGLYIVDGGLPTQWRGALPEPRVYVPAGELSKDMRVVEAVLEAALEHGLTRSAVLVGVGGGALTDTVACAASLYMRGVRTVLIPTTLLAMVDASIGGKTAVDFGGYKNLVGTFYPAAEVRIVPEFVSTLSEREYRSGLAEVIKAAMLADAELFRLLETRRAAVLARDAEVVEELIERAVAVKAAIVQEDFYEHGRRAFLNLGHTFAHALETVGGLGRWSHGEAVAWGITRALQAGVAVGVTDADYAKRVTQMLNAYGYQTAPVALDPDLLIAAMNKDKKRTPEGLPFVLQREMLQTVRHTLPEMTLRAILTA